MTIDRTAKTTLATAALAAAFILLAPSPGAAQDGGLIFGRVVAEDTGAPVGTAFLVVRAAGDTVATATAASDGRFQFTNIPAGRYELVASFLGYSPAVVEVVVTAGTVFDAGTLRLPLDAIELDAIEVETDRPAAVFAPDRDIYSADALAAAAGGVATELLSSIPELEVDIDGAVSLRGSSPEIYINGRPAPMEGEALNIFLQQFPSDAIERIEVIPNPSARYDAEGAGGIINIVLKEGVELGFSGSVFANVNSRGQAGTGGRVTWQRGPLTLNSHLFVRRSDEERDSYDFRQNLNTDPTTFLRQDSRSDRNGLSGNGRLVAELALGERTTLRAEGSFSQNGSESERWNTTSHMDEAQAITQRYNRYASSESDGRSIDAALSFEHDFREGRELQIDVEFDTGRDDEYERVETEFEILEGGAAPVPAELTIEDNDDRDRETTVEVDYVMPWGDEGEIELGYRGRFESADENRVLDEFLDLSPGAEPVETMRGVSQDETRNSAYLTLTRSFGALGVQIGARAEHTDMRFVVPTGESFDNDFFDIYPSANVTYRMGEAGRLRLSYSRRVRRPSPRHLNPINESTDPLNIRIGNPDLEPQYTHSFGMSLSRSTSWGTLRLSPYYRRETNNWARVQTVDEDGVSTSTWANIASQSSYGASLTTSIRHGDGWRGYVSLSARGEDRDADNVRGSLSGRSLYWSLRGNISGRIWSDLGMRANMSYTPARDVPQGRQGSRVMTSIGLRQQFLDGRASLNLTVRDPFDMYDSSFESRDPTFIQIGRTEVSRRSASVSFSYSFGGGPSGGDRGDRGGRGGPRGRRGPS